MFIAHCFDKNLASSTVLTFISALSYLLKLGGYELESSVVVVLFPLPLLLGEMHGKPTNT
jgi:hypothetical protein